MSDPRPRQRHRRLLVVLPFVAVLLAVGIKLVTMYAFSAAGVAAYDAGAYATSESRFERLQPFNRLHPWRAHVGIGDARYRQGDLAGAERSFARALQLAPTRCDVRFNLAVTLEAQGDLLVSTDVVARRRFDLPTAGDAIAGDPVERYLAALDVVNAGDCPSERADDPGERIARTGERVLDKLVALDPQNAPGEDEGNEPGESSEGNDTGSGERIEQLGDLAERNRAAASQRDEGRDRGAPGVIPEGQSNW